MRKINEFINEKLKVTKNYRGDTTKIPPVINDVHKEYLNTLYATIKMMARDKGISEDDDLSELVNYYKAYTKNDKKYQTKEMIWAYISVVLGYDYMFDNSSRERWINRYLTDLYDEVDPVEEFVYRAVEHANNYGG